MKFLTSSTHFLIIIVVSMLATASVVFSQDPPMPTRGAPVKPKIKEKPPKFPPAGDLPPGVVWGEGTTSERSIAVDPKVTITMCVTQGNVSVSGWGRGEVRAFVKEGSRFGFRVLQKSSKGDPVLISLVSMKQLPGGTVTISDCILGDEIELDVPENAALSLKGRETATTVEGVRKVGVSNIGGDISIRNVAQGIRASTYQGDVTVENSQGGMVLESSSGNIVAYDVAPADAGDAFKAKTNSGAISLQKMEFRLSEVNSLSGSILFIGPLLSGGSFSFGTTNGAIRLLIPQNTSCKVAATYGFGLFNSEIPIKIETEDVRPGSVKSVVGTIGAGDCVLRLTTNSGAIAIRKQSL
jgi:hypothetical protein